MRQNESETIVEAWKKRNVGRLEFKVRGEPFDVPPPADYTDYLIDYKPNRGD